MNKFVAVLTTVLFLCSGAFALSVPPKNADATSVAASKKHLAKSHNLSAAHKVSAKHKALAKHHKALAKHKTKPLAAKSVKLTKTKVSKSSSLKTAKARHLAKRGNKATAKVSHTSAKPVSQIAKSSRNL